MKKYIRITAVIFLIISIIFIYSRETYADTMNAYFMSDSNFNIWGDGVQTTYGDHGYDTTLDVNGAQTTIKNGTGSLDGITVKTNLSNISEGNYAKVEYEIKNTNSSSRTIGIATYADIQIGSNDYAPISNLAGNRGFTMSDGTHVFTFIGRDSYGVTNVDTYWFGTFSYRTQNMWNISYTYDSYGGNRDLDSGMAYSWKNRTIGPNETQKYSIIIGIGKLNTPPTINVTSTFNTAYYPTQTVQVKGTVNDVDIGDVVTVKYAIDAGNEITIGSNYRPNGVAVPFQTSFTIPTNISAGRHMIQLWAADDKGNMSVPVTVYFTVGADTTAPTATHTITPSTWTRGNVTISLRVTDSESGVKNIVLPNGQVVTNTNPSYVATENGNYKFVLVDNVGNSRDYIVPISNIDRTAPTISATPKNKSWAQETQIQISFTDTQSGFKQYKYAITDSEDTPTNWSNYITNSTDTITINTETKKYLHIIAEDNAGNVSEDSITGPYYIDRTAPSITVTPQNSDWVQEVQVQVIFTDAGSGVKQYKYAITDSKDTPTNWSEYITKTTDTITINAESIKYLHVIAEDNVGNISEDNITGPYYIDRTAPSITVTPQNSDWTREVQINVSFSDSASGFKQYKYAITDSRNTPTTWSDYITSAEDTITINTESEKYLHIIAEDNAGNISEDNVTGAYLIDRTDPTIQVIGDLKTIVIDELTLNLQANDVPSGVETFKLDGEIIFNGNHTFYKNGTHTLEAIDKAGNTYTTEFAITNIYYECDAGLEHPIYSSDYDSCPICEAFKGLAVTNVKDVYNSEKQGVKYDNPRGAEIVEYYDGIKENPEDAKEYDYELKVVYEGEEYKTGLIGKYTITPKVITIEDILATNKVYNGNTTVVVSGGRLIGVCEGDNLQFELPMTGEAETKNVGRWKVAIEKINLIGDDAENYILTHPAYGDIMVEITPRPLRVINLNGKNRIYNKETTVEIEGGEFDNLVEGDDVVADIPETGESEDPNTGTWRVSIEEITLSGKDAGNYTFTQPEYGEIMVTISKETGTLEIGCESKKYDRELIEPYVINKNTTSEVTYKYYKAGTDEEVERPYDIGEYDVVAYAETDGNYTEIESNKVTFEITKPDAPMIGIESRVVKVNEQTVTAEEQPADMEYGDLVTIEIRIRNEGIGSGYAKEVTSTIADGMEYVEDNEINKANGWVLDGKKVTTNKYSYEADMDNELYPKSEEINNISSGDNTDNDTSERENPYNTENAENNSNDGSNENNNGDNSNEDDNSSIGSNTEGDSEEEIPEEPEQEKNTGRHTLQLVLRVTKNDKTQDRLLSQITVEQQDKRGDVVEYTEEDKENSKNRVEMQYTYTDLKIEKRITQILTTDKTTNTVKKYDMYQEPGKIVKLELPNKNIENTKLTITYEIKVTNVGNHNAEIDEIVDLIPTGAIFTKEGNEGWYVGESGHIIYDKFEDYLRPKEEKSIKLKLTYELDEKGLAQIQSNAYLLSKTDLDERIITDEGSTKIENTNNYTKSELIVSVITGETIIIYILAIFGGMLIVVTGISLIKKYIL